MSEIIDYTMIKYTVYKNYVENFDVVMLLIVVIIVLYFISYVFSFFFKFQFIVLASVLISYYMYKNNMGGTLMENIKTI